MKPIAVIEAPSILGLRPTGVEHLPHALSRAGLLEALHARHAGVADYSRRLAASAGQVLEEGSFALVLGGDCSILLGSMLALNRRERTGLLFLDGHMDFYNAEANVNSEAASSDLALATGRGPSLLTTYDGRCPLVRDEDVVAFGFRDEREAQTYGSQPLPAQMKAISLEQVRRLGVAAAAREAVAHASGQGARDFWIHFDADVLDALLLRGTADQAEPIRRPKSSTLRR